MRLTLLALAFFYAWLPSGLCACRLQAALFPPPRSAGDIPPTEPGDDDDGPHECHCTGAKPLCVVAATPCLTDDGLTALVAVVNVAGCPTFAAVHDNCLRPPFHHVLRLPLYLTLRALLI